MTIDIKQILVDFDPVLVHPLELRATVDAILESLGSPDAELREQLIFPKFSSLLRSAHLPEAELLRILDICLSDTHLFCNIENMSSAVLVRADSGWIISEILLINAKNNFLTLAKLDEIIDRVLLYIAREEDGRGYIEDEGWAHAIANGIDMLGALVANPQVPTSGYEDILIAIESCLFKKTPYFHQEGERAAEVVRAMMDKGISSDTIGQWMNQMSARLAETFDAQGFTYKFHCNNVNVSNFLKSLYFGFKKTGERVKMRVDIYDNIRKLQRF
ncbi:MAG: DUF2785 domain-containing protein [Defluviitaleaceae bacterium]|nr:DUF2785 domain-containing protein [Defluviitaleaceae bacterium]